MAAGSPETLRHINRALRLYPQSPAPHMLASRYLASIGRRQQAAMEYRLAVERGHPFIYADVARVVGPQNVMRAVPQRTDDLLSLAGALVQAGRPGDADTASARAVQLAEEHEAARIRRMEIALASRDKTFVAKAAVELARVAGDPKGVELAAEGLAVAGDVAGARTVLRHGLDANPGDGGMALRSARILLNHGDVDGARTLLAQLPEQNPVAPGSHRQRAPAGGDRRQAGRPRGSGRRARAGQTAGTAGGKILGAALSGSVFPSRVSPERYASDGCGSPGRRSSHPVGRSGPSRSCRSR